MEKIINKIFSSLFFKRNKEFKEFIDNIEIDLDIINFEKFKSNILHIIVQNNDLELLKYIIDKFESTVKNEKEIRKRIWINSLNNLSYTPIFYAFYNGNADIIEYLIGEGAEINIKAKNGNNLLHVAVENDQAICLFLFKKHKIIYERNNDGMNPFLYSVYMRSKNCINFFLANNTNLKTKDYNGNNALLLSVIDGNTKLLYKLLIYGLNPYLKNKENKNSFDIAKENEFYNILKVLNIKSSLKTFCNIKINPRTILKNNKLKFIICIKYLILLKIILFNFPYFKNFIICTIHFIYFNLYIMYYAIISLKKPSKIKKGKNKNYFKILKKQSEFKDNNFKICHFCKIQFKDNYKHCDKCKICIVNFDHHCQFLDLCISNYNLLEFLLYLIISQITIIYIFVQDILIYSNYYNYNEKLDLKYYISQSKYWEILNIIILILLLFFFIFLLPLVYVQISNIFIGKTTYERFKKVDIKKSNEESSLEESLTNFSTGIKNKGYFKNCNLMLYKNR